MQNKSNTVKRMVFSNYRKSFKKTQREVAFAVGVTESHIRHIENGRANPDAKLLFKLVKYFGTNAEMLFPDLADQDIEFAGK